MKHKRLLIGSILIAVAVAGWGVHSYWRTWFPSQQMQGLLQQEKALGLPKARFRSVEDAGYNQDLKGARHYDRHIALSYTDDSLLSGLRAKLQAEQWQEDKSNGSENFDGGRYYKYSKGQGEAAMCIAISETPQNNETKLHVRLEAAGEYACYPKPGI